MSKVYVLNKFERNYYPNSIEIDVTSKGGYFKDLSPFYVGPVKIRSIYSNRIVTVCNVFENFWQYSKVYEQHYDRVNNCIKDEWYKWQEEGFKNNRAVRYPMKKGTKPLFSFFNGEFLDYIQARKNIYIPYYMDLVSYTKSYEKLFNWLHKEKRDLVLRDYDGYDNVKMKMTLSQVINNPRRVMGHAFIIMGMLTGEIHQAIK